MTSEHYNCTGTGARTNPATPQKTWRLTEKRTSVVLEDICSPLHPGAHDKEKELLQKFLLLSVEVDNRNVLRGGFWYSKKFVYRNAWGKIKTYKSF